MSDTDSVVLIEGSFAGNAYRVRGGDAGFIGQTKMHGDDSYHDLPVTNSLDDAIFLCKQFIGNKILASKSDTLGAVQP